MNMCLIGIKFSVLIKLMSEQLKHNYAKYTVLVECSCHEVIL